MYNEGEFIKFKDLVYLESCKLIGHLIAISLIIIIYTVSGSRVGYNDLNLNLPSALGYFFGTDICMGYVMISTIQQTAMEIIEVKANPHKFYIISLVYIKLFFLSICNFIVMGCWIAFKYDSISKSYNYISLAAIVIILFVLILDYISKFLRHRYKRWIGKAEKISGGKKTKRLKSVLKEHGINSTVGLRFGYKVHSYMSLILKMAFIIIYLSLRFKAEDAYIFEYLQSHKE